MHPKGYDFDDYTQRENERFMEWLYEFHIDDVRYKLRVFCCKKCLTQSRVHFAFNK